MGKVAKISIFSPEDRARIDMTIRAYSFSRYKEMASELAANRIVISRSSLHRYGQQLQRIEGVRLADKNVTLIVIVNRATGHTKTVLTAASSARVADAVCGLKPAPQELPQV